MDLSNETHCVLCRAVDSIRDPDTELLPGADMSGDTLCYGCGVPLVTGQDTRELIDQGVKPVCINCVRKEVGLDFPLGEEWKKNTRRKAELRMTQGARDALSTHLRGDTRVLAESFIERYDIQVSGMDQLKSELANPVTTPKKRSWAKPWEWFR